ncbi:glycosyltransferase family 61 protein [Ochrobactrum haematophilum]|uniref:Glycosyltransferase family 61 protein n=1 Tax=Brucella haematophila TaxID=419474 RepID=A0ABX1DLH2_9HYPH|nr:glycosyltransferase family 61 protein [Brucella haematophila]
MFGSGFVEAAASECRLTVRWTERLHMKNVFSQCFEAAWYRQQYQDGIGLIDDVWDHYFQVGWKKGFDPCEFFWGRWYLEKYPDVAAAGMNPLQHYEQYGALELRDPSPLFDTGWYVRTYGVDQKLVNPLSHFLGEGRRCGYIPRADLAVKSFMQGEAIGGHASITLDQIEWKMIHAGQDALHHAIVSTGRAYCAAQQLEIIEQPILREIAHEMRNRGIKHAVAPYSVTLNDVFVIPGSTMLAKESMIISDEIAISPSTASLKLWDRTWRSGDNILLKYKVGLNPKVKSGLHLFKEYEQNYFHFVAELMPKLVYFEQMGFDVSIPLLVSGDLDGRLYELIDLLKHPDRKLLKLDRNVPYLVEKLFYVSDLSLVRDVYDRKPETFDTYLPAPLLTAIVDKVADGNLEPCTRRRRKLFLTRHGRHRKIVNEQEIIDALLKMDFEVIDLSILSIKSQVELFLSADVIVGGTGAGFTNLLWCRPNTKAVVLYPDHPYNNTTFWDQIGAARRLDITYIDGPRANVVTGVHSMHDDFTIDLQQLKDVL